MDSLDTTPSLRKPRALYQLNSEIIEKILHAVKVWNWSYQEVAIKYNVSINLIGK